jgi:hypothetical protein
MPMTNVTSNLNNNFDWVPSHFRYLINDSSARFTLRTLFYQKYGFSRNFFHKIIQIILKWISGKDGFGRSELDFMEWEIKRGVLNACNASVSAGSWWWSNVNLMLIVISETAADIYEKKITPNEISNETELWLQYLNCRTAQTWYRAHNASIVYAYLQFADLAKKESVYEQVFMNEVLYRLLYAQAMVEDTTIFDDFGVIGANPMLPAVELMVNVPEFYPVHYPLDKTDIVNVMHKGYGIEEDAARLLDVFLIGTQISKLYSNAAIWLNNSNLLKLEENGNPVYPNY